MERAPNRTHPPRKDRAAQVAALLRDLGRRAEEAAGLCAALGVRVRTAPLAGALRDAAGDAVHQLLAEEAAEAAGDLPVRIPSAGLRRLLPAGDIEALEGWEPAAFDAWRRGRLGPYPEDAALRELGRSAHAILMRGGTDPLADRRGRDRNLMEIGVRLYRPPRANGPWLADPVERSEGVGLLRGFATLVRHATTAEPLSACRPELPGPLGHDAAPMADGAEILRPHAGFVPGMISWRITRRGNPAFLLREATTENLRTIIGASLRPGGRRGEPAQAELFPAERSGQGVAGGRRGEEVGHAGPGD